MRFTKELCFPINDIGTDLFKQKIEFANDAQCFMQLITNHFKFILLYFKY
jgi:hypothetical protein